MTEEKRKFAEALLANPSQPYQAALAAFPADPGRALQIADLWANDPEVKQICEELKNKHGERAFLPTKETVSREVLEIGRDDRIEDAKTRLAAYRLVAEILGYIEKPQQQTNVNVNTSYRVMQTKDHGSDADWERKAIEQQRQLVDNARTRH